MKIASQQDIDSVNGKFNHFHDGLIKRIVVTSGSEFLTDMPWEAHRQFASDEEELEAVFLMYGHTAVELDLHHYNYDWPNQPRRRSIIVRASPAKISEKILAFIGCDVFGLAFAKDAGGISCVLTHHASDAGPMRSTQNGVKTILFSAAEMEIEETTWAEQGAASPPPAPQSGPSEGAR